MKSFEWGFHHGWISFHVVSPIVLFLTYIDKFLRVKGSFQGAGPQNHPTLPIFSKETMGSKCFGSTPTSRNVPICNHNEMINKHPKTGALRETYTQSPYRFPNISWEGNYTPKTSPKTSPKTFSQEVFANLGLHLSIPGTRRRVATATAAAEVVEVGLRPAGSSHRSLVCKGPLGSAVGLLEQLRKAPAASARLWFESTSPQGHAPGDPGSAHLESMSWKVFHGG